MNKQDYQGFNFDLQLFAEKAEAGEASEVADKAEEKQKTDEGKKEDNVEDKEKGYTEKDIETIKKDMTEKQQQAIDEAVSDAIKEQKRLSQLSEEERAKEEAGAKERALSEREKAIEFKEKLSEVKDELLERKLPAAFAEYFVSNDSAAALDKIKDFDKNFKIAVQDAVDAKIKGVSMKAGAESSKSDGKSFAQLKNEQKEIDIDPWAKK